MRHLLQTLVTLHLLHLSTNRSCSFTWGRGLFFPGHLCLVPSSDLRVEQLPSSGLDPGPWLGQVEHEAWKLEVVGVQRGALGTSQGREMKTGLGPGSLRVTEQAGWKKAELL